MVFDYQVVMGRISRKGILCINFRDYLKIIPEKGSSNCQTKKASRLACLFKYSSIAAQYFLVGSISISVNIGSVVAGNGFL